MKHNTMPHMIVNSNLTTFDGPISFHKWDVLPLTFANDNNGVSDIAGLPDTTRIF